MLKKPRTLNIKRKFSEEFKLNVVKEYESGCYTSLELSRLFAISQTNIYNWIYKYSTYNKKNTRIVEMVESTSKKVTDLQKRVKELEQIVGQKQIKLDYLEKMMELAKEHYGIDLKKTPTPHNRTLQRKQKKDELFT